MLAHRTLHSYWLSYRSTEIRISTTYEFGRWTAYRSSRRRQSNVLFEGNYKDFVLLGWNVGIHDLRCSTGNSFTCRKLIIRINLHIQNVTKIAGVQFRDIFMKFLPVFRQISIVVTFSLFHGKWSLLSYDKPFIHSPFTKIVFSFLFHQFAKCRQEI